MLKTYQGYFKKGSFISSDNSIIPEMKKVIVTVLDDDLSDEKNSIADNIIDANQQRIAFEEYFKAIDEIKDENFTEADFYELENNRINLNREIDL